MDLRENNLDRIELINFNCIFGTSIFSDFGDTDVFLNLVKEQKAYAEKEKIEKSLSGNEKEKLHSRKRI